MFKVKFKKRKKNFFHCFMYYKCFVFVFLFLFMKYFVNIILYVYIDQEEMYCIYENVMCILGA